jgi:hypothetical protein
MKKVLRTKQVKGTVVLLGHNKCFSSSSSVALQSEVDLDRLLDTSPSVPISGCHPPIPTS